MKPDHMPVWAPAPADIAHILENRFQCGYSGVFVHPLGTRYPEPTADNAACAYRRGRPGTKIYARRARRNGTYHWMVREVPA